MKKFFILYIIAVSIMMAYFMSPKKSIIQGHTVTEEEAEAYKQRIMTKYNVTEEKAKEMKEKYIKDGTIEERETTKQGKSFFESLIISSIIFIAFYGIFRIIFYIKFANYHELFGESPNDSLHGWSFFFWKKWF